MGINFPKRSQTKTSPTKAVTYTKHFFVDREVKKLRALGTRWPTKVDVLGYTTTHSKQLQLIQIIGKTKLRLKRSVKGIYSQVA